MIETWPSTFGLAVLIVPPYILHAMPSVPTILFATPPIITEKSALGFIILLDDPPPMKVASAFDVLSRPPPIKDDPAFIKIFF